MSKHRVLLIDDEDDIRSIAAIALERVGGWEVKAAADGAAGVAIAEEWRPDAILLDAMMPGMDGLATLKALRKRPGTDTIPVVFLTASVQTAERQVLLDAGAAGVLANPFDPMTHHQVVSQALGWSA